MSKANFRSKANMTKILCNIKTKCIITTELQDNITTIGKYHFNITTFLLMILD